MAGGRRGLVAPQNTFLENIVRRSNGKGPWTEGRFGAEGLRAPRCGAAAVGLRPRVPSGASCGRQVRRDGPALCPPWGETAGGRRPGGRRAGPGERSCGVSGRAEPGASGKMPPK